jgi:LacI family transcriptional regulator
VTPAISVIEQPVYELGSTAARVIIDRISGRRDEPTRELLLDTRFIERDSLRSL